MMAKTETTVLEDSRLAASCSGRSQEMELAAYQDHAWKALTTGFMMKEAMGYSCIASVVMRGLEY